MLKNQIQDKKALVIFVKVPVPGKVKTRLVDEKILNSKDAAGLAEAMFKDTITLALKADVQTICIGYHPKDQDHEILKILDKLDLSIDELNIELILYEQDGTNFDQRFSSVVKNLFNDGYEQLIIIGADLPYLDPKLIDLAFLKLEENNEIVVIGPSGEGGVYLVGLTKDFNPDWFIDHKIFTGGIEISQFVKLRKQGFFSLFLLPPLFDIDVSEDLISLITILDPINLSEEKMYYHYPEHTSKYLKELRLQIGYTLGETRKRFLKKM